MKNLLKIFASLFLLLALPTTVFAQGEVKAEYDVTLAAFVDIDSFSTIDVTPANNEVGLRSDVVVRVVDRNGTPLSGHSIHLYIEAADGTVLFVQPSDTDSDGYARGKVRALNEGAFVIRAYDSTYGQNVVLSDSDTFYVFPVPTPQLSSEPYYTKGNRNKLTWEEVDGLDTYEYYLQASTDSKFNNIVSNSGWVSSFAYEFNNLNGAQIYFYRVKAQNSGDAESGWSNARFSVQDDQSPVIKVVDISFNKEGDNISGIVIDLDVTDDLSLKQVSLYCARSNGDLDECGVLEHDGANYIASVPLSDLERGGLSSLLDEYTFCTEAFDEAGNSSQNCDAKISTKEQEPGTSVIVDIIDTVVDKANNWIRVVDLNVSGLLDGTQTWILEVTSSLFILSAGSLALGIFTGSFLLIPSFVTAWIFKMLKFIGLKPHGTPGGLVYDVVSKKPVKWALVEIFDNSNNLVWRDFTSETGEFMTDLPVGKYRVSVKTPRYLFPSQLVKPREDRKLGKIYRGEYVMVTEKKPLSAAIPMDPVGMRVEKEPTMWNMKREGVLKSFNILVIALGLGLALYLVGRSPSLLNILVLLAYIPGVFLYLKGVFRLKLGSA